MEEWRPIVGAEGFYEVSNLGRVRRDIPSARFGRSEPGRVKKPSLNKKGYPIVAMTLGTKATKICRTVHRLVAEAFLSNREGKPQVNHKNGIKSDNRVENLEWVTASENTLHGYRCGLMPDRRGENHGMAILTEAEVREILATPKTIGSGRALARRFGVSEHVVGKVRSRKNWKHVA